MMRSAILMLMVMMFSIGLRSATAAPAPAPGPATPAPAPAPAPARAPAATPPPVAPVAGGVGLPTLEQLNAQLAEGKHADVLKQVAKLLQIKGEAAKTYDRYDLLCLRGEAALR